MQNSNSAAVSVASQPLTARPRLWAVGGGKGGVGKSFISANMGVALGREGKRVVLVDLDLGGANLHTALGVSHCSTTLSDIFSAETHDINQLIAGSGIEHVGLISGAGDTLNIANMKYFQKMKLLRNLKHLDADYVILDLGAGTSFNTLDFFVCADRGLLSVTPDPASIENGYRFLKCALMRKLNSASLEAKTMLNDVLHGRRNSGERAGTLSDVLRVVDERDSELARALREELALLKLHLIVNQVQEPSDTELGNAIQMACNRYFDVEVDYLGHLQHDQQVLQSLKQRKPFLTAFPQSRSTIHIEHMVSSLLSMDSSAE